MENPIDTLANPQAALLKMILIEVGKSSLNGFDGAMERAGAAFAELYAQQLRESGVAGEEVIKKVAEVLGVDPETGRPLPPETSRY